MDRPIKGGMKSPAALRELAQRLFSASPQFEPATPSAVQDLQSMGSLEELIRSSLAPMPAAPVPDAPQVPAPHANRSAPPSRKPAVRAPLPDIRYESANQEYRPALQDRDLVEALLEFHRRKSPKAAPARRGIEPFPVAEVDAQVKPGTAAYRRRPGVYHPILRPASDAGPGANEDE